MYTPGRFIVTRYPNGREVWEPLRETLKDLWIGDDYQHFIGELDRHGYLVAKKLMMEGPEVKGLIDWMYINQKIDAPKTRLFEALKNTFDLSFNNVRSLQGDGAKKFEFVRRNELESFQETADKATFIKTKNNGKEVTTR